MTIDATLSSTMIEAARTGFVEAQKRAGTSDIVARVRRLPDLTLDLLWERRVAMQTKLRYGGVGGTHPALTRIAAGLTRAAAKGTFFVVAITMLDDSDATLFTATKLPVKAA